MVECPTSAAASDATAAYGSQQAEWLTYREAAERLGIDAAAVAARARRGRWPKRRRNEPPNAAEVLVPAELLAAGPQAPQEREKTPAPALTLTELGAAVRQIVAPLQESLDREVAERRALQVEADGLRDRLAVSQSATARATGETEVERVKREAAEARAQDLQDRLDRVQGQLDAKMAEPPKPAPRRWWWQR